MKKALLRSKERLLTIARLGHGGPDVCVCVCELRNVKSVFAVHNAHQSTTCSLVENDKLRWREGGGSVRRDDRERTEGEKEEKGNAAHDRYLSRKSFTNETNAATST